MDLNDKIADVVQEIPKFHIVDPACGVAHKGNQVWDPIQATRMSSRIQRDGRSIIEKALELKKTKNLELPLENQRRRKKHITVLEGPDGHVEDNKGVMVEN